MSEPNIDVKDALQGAMNELISAESSLNMGPDPIPDAEGFLSRTDGNVRHALEHMHAVFTLLLQASNERESDRYKIHRLEVQLAEARQKLVEWSAGEK